MASHRPIKLTKLERHDTTVQLCSRIFLPETWIQILFVCTKNFIKVLKTVQNAKTLNKQSDGIQSQ